MRAARVGGREVGGRAGDCAATGEGCAVELVAVEVERDALLDGERVNRRVCG